MATGSKQLHISGLSTIFTIPSWKQNKIVTKLHQLEAKCPFYRRAEKQGFKNEAGKTSTAVFLGNAQTATTMLETSNEDSRIRRV